MGGHGAGSDADLERLLEHLKTKKPETLTEYQRQLLKWTRNVDQRYAWVVLVALWFMMAAILGPYRIYGLLYAKITSVGEYTREEASWPVAMIFTFENMVGPFISVLVYYLTYRQSLFVGSLLLVFGNGLCTYSRSLVTDVLLIGVVQGLGYAFIFMPFMEIINNYFLRYRNIAFGVALSGGTLSIFALTPLFQWLLETYPWRYSYLGIGCVCCINLIAVPILKPNPRPSPSMACKTQNMAFGDTLDGNPQLSDRNTLARMSIRALTYQNSVRRQSTIMISRPVATQHQQQIPQVSDAASTTTTSTVVASPLQPSAVQHLASMRQSSVVSMNPFASTVGLERRISRTLSSDIVAQQAANLQQTNGQLDASGLVSAGRTKMQGAILTQLTAKSPTDFETVSLSEAYQEISEEEFGWATIKDVLKTPAFHLIWYNELLYFWVFSVYCLCLVDYGVDRGCTRDEAQSLLRFQSIGELLGRLGLTILVDMQYISNRSVIILILLTMASMLTLVTQITGFMYMAAITCVLSAQSSLLYIMLNGLLIDYLGEKKVTIGYGMGSFIGGLLMSFRPQVVGYFRDRMGTYNPLMILLAVACAIGAFMWLIEPVLSRISRRGSRESDKKQNNDIDYRINV